MYFFCGDLCKWTISDILFFVVVLVDDCLLYSMVTSLTDIYNAICHLYIYSLIGFLFTHSCIPSKKSGLAVRSDF